MNSEKLTVCINCGLVIEECSCDKTNPYFTILESGWGTKWEIGNSIEITIEGNKPMYCTEQELKGYIETLSEKVDSIDESIMDLERAINYVNTLSVLEKRGVNSFLTDIREEISSYRDLSADVVNFQLNG